MSAPHYRETTKGLCIFVHVTPNARHNRLQGVRESADDACRLNVHVTVSPDKGRANKAVLKLLARAWRLRVSDLSIERGVTSRDKTVLIRGLAADLQHAIISKTE